MARRSARLASVTKTPKQSSTAPNLSSLTERAESPASGASPSLDATVASPMPQTPGAATPTKPPHSEMHPSKVHSTMGPPSSAARLGFTDIVKPSAGAGYGPAHTQGTPSKTAAAPASSPFDFRFPRQAAETTLGPDAQRMMDEIREEAARIRVELAAKREAERAAEEEEEADSERNGRKIAQPRGRAGRYSAAHMAQFKKMDSIANHPSAFRAQTGRATPAAASSSSTGLKRKQSRANLHDSGEPSDAKKSAAQTAPKTKPLARGAFEADSSAKRARQRFEDDASSSRPVSRDASSIPRPKSSGRDFAATGGGIPRTQSSLASLMTPTKSSMARTTTAKTPAQMAKSPQKATTTTGIQRSATTTNVTGQAAVEETPASVGVRSPKSRLNRVKALFRSPKSRPASGIPFPSQPAAAPAATSPTRAEDKPLPPLPSAPVATPGRKLATPSRKLSKRVGFTPEVTRFGGDKTPSPVKSGIPRSKSQRRVLGEVCYPALDTVMTEDGGADGRDVSYPDLGLSSYRPGSEQQQKQHGAAEGSNQAAAAAGPSTFTFRSDHTIDFGATSPSGFGSSPGQSSVRHVRPSLLPTVDMPGSFPTGSPVPRSGPNKENVTPPPPALATKTPKTSMMPRSAGFKALPHGMIQKKRHRVSTDEEDAEREAAERAAKKRKDEHVPEGDALMAPRLAAARSGSAAKPHVLSPGRKLMRTPRGAGTPSPSKKGATLSISRLNMLARPKMRKGQ